MMRGARGLFLAAATTVLVCAAMYWLPQYWHRGEPALLPLTALDRLIPFWPVSGVLYFGAFIFLALTFITLWADRKRAVRFLYACLFAQLLGMLCFLLWPTAYPRELYPPPASTSALGAALVAWCRANDLALNCLPSLHVSTLVICVAALRGSRWFLPAALFAVPTALSTLTFKQHYVVDVIAGAALGGLASALFLRPMARTS
jgi:membrane-associated phospholipid phosphatase